MHIVVYTLPAHHASSLLHVGSSCDSLVVECILQYIDERCNNQILSEAWVYEWSLLGSMQSKIQDGKATSSPEVLTRRGAWEEAQVHANLMAASDAGHRAPIDSTPKVPSAGANHTGRVQSCTAAQAAACKVAVVNHLATMYNKSQENPQQPIAPLPHIETQIIPRETDQRRNADEAPQAELLADQGTTSAKDRGKKLAASVAEEHISSAPWHSPTDGSDHPKQLEGQEESGRGVERVTIPTAKVACGLHC